MIRYCNSSPLKYDRSNLTTLFSSLVDNFSESIFAQYFVEKVAREKRSCTFGEILWNKASISSNAFTKLLSSYSWQSRDIFISSSLIFSFVKETLFSVTYLNPLQLLLHSSGYFLFFLFLVLSQILHLTPWLCESINRSIDGILRILNRRRTWLDSKVCFWKLISSSNSCSFNWL